MAVFFEALLTTATATTRPFSELEYRWNFADAGSGSWTNTPNMPNLSRNLATGPVAAHVFAVPVDFRLKALPNPATGTGLATAPVYSDLFRLRRPQIGVIDRGAVEGP